MAAFHQSGPSFAHADVSFRRNERLVRMLMTKRPDAYRYSDFSICHVDPKQPSTWQFHPNESTLILPECHSDSIRCCVALHNGLLLTGSQDHLCKVWRLSSDGLGGGRCEATLRGHSQRVLCMCQLPRGDGRMLTGSGDKTIRCWDPSGTRCWRQRKPRPASAGISLPEIPGFLSLTIRPGSRPSRLRSRI